MTDVQDLGAAEPALAVDEALVIRIQTLFRCRRARREGVELANRAYLKCWDAATGFAYYCNLRTGLSSWKKPLLLAARDVVEGSAATLSNQQQAATSSELVPPSPPTTDPLSVLTSKEWQERHDESVAFQQKCAAEKRDLLVKHRRKVARAMRRFEKNALDEKRQARVDRLARLKNENQTLLQDLYDGKKVFEQRTTPCSALILGGDLIRVSLFASCAAVGARIHMEDAQGETIFDGMSDVANREIVAQACQVWSSRNAAVFPTEFRQVSLALALVSKRQLNAFIAEKTTTRRELILTKQTLQRQCAEAKVRYDQELRGCKLEATLVRRLAAIEAADSRYEAERRRLLYKLQDAVNKLHNSDRPPFLPERAILNILAFCGRHWFEIDRRQTRPARTKKAANKAQTRPELERWETSAVVPCTLRAAPDRLPIDLELEWDALHENLKVELVDRSQAEYAALLPDCIARCVTQRLCDQLQTVESNEHFDTKSGVSRDASGLSLATLDVCIEQAENLPYRDPRIGDTVRNPALLATRQYGNALTCSPISMPDRSFRSRFPAIHLDKRR
ncbi:hypothetical protein BBJ28_00003459 [Nothophytophthora sp. Chile5]|nr:hypothetical protein BBJ28_00003459 [Nothophytophthora sp. Chile5]